MGLFRDDANYLKFLFGKLAEIENSNDRLKVTKLMDTFIASQTNENML